MRPQSLRAGGRLACEISPALRGQRGVRGAENDAVVQGHLVRRGGLGKRRPCTRGSTVTVAHGDLAGALGLGLLKGR
eukprot:7044621-Lingulodinium_polyedra.AAC.1